MANLLDLRCRLAAQRISFVNEVGSEDGYAAVADLSFAAYQRPVRQHRARQRPERSIPYSVVGSS